jgi:hypothetical protein
MAGSDVEILIGARIDPLTTALASAKSSVNSFTNDVKGALGGLSSSFGSVTGAFTGLGAALGGGALAGALAGVATALEKFGGYAAEISTMSATLGVTTDQFQAMKAVADETTVSQEVMARGVERLTNSLNEARQGSAAAIENLKNLGVTNQQIASPTFTIADLLQTLHNRLNDTNTAAATQATLLQELGVRGAQFATWLKAADLSSAGVAEQMDKVNGLTKEQIADLTAAFAAWKTFGQEIENAFAKATLAAVKFYGFLKENLSKAGPGGGGAPTPTAETAKVGTIDRGQAEAAQASASAAVQIAQSHDITEAVLKDLKEQVAETQAGTAERLAAAQKYYDAVKQYFAGTAEKTETAAAHAELLSAEREYQAKRIELENQSTAAIKASTAAAMKAATEAVDEATKALDVMVEDARGDYKAQEEAAVGSITRQIDAIHAQAAEHRISSAEELSDTQALLGQEWADEQAYYAKLRALQVASGASTKAVDTAEETAHQAYLSAMQAADKKYTTEMAADWKQLGLQMQTSIASNLTAMIERTKTFTQAVHALLGSLIDSLIQMFVKMAIQWIVNQLMQQAASTATANAQIGIASAVAGAEGTASFAGAPWPVDLGAPAFGAQMAAVAAGYSIGSAYGGYEVPSGLNPLTQLHEGEHVLPESIASRYKSNAPDGGGGGRAGDTNNFHIAAHDARGLEGFLRSPGGQKLITETISRAYRRGTRGTRR